MKRCLQADVIATTWLFFIHLKYNTQERSRFTLVTPSKPLLLLCSVSQTILRDSYQLGLHLGSETIF